MILQISDADAIRIDQGQQESTDEDFLDSTAGSSTETTDQSAKEAYKNFVNFKNWYATKLACTKEELSTLHLVQSKIEEMITD